MILQTANLSPLSHSNSLLPLNLRPKNLPRQAIFPQYYAPVLTISRSGRALTVTRFCNLQAIRITFLCDIIGDAVILHVACDKIQYYGATFTCCFPKFIQVQSIKRANGFIKFHAIFRRELAMESYKPTNFENSFRKLLTIEDNVIVKRLIIWATVFSFGSSSSLISAQVANASENVRADVVYEIGELFELGIQLSYLLLLLGLLGVGTFFVIRQVLVRRELDLSAKELQEQVRSGDATATECFELGAVMLRRKFYPAATKYLLQAIEKWDGDDQDLAQVYNALGVSYIRDGKLDKGITQFETAVQLQPGYVTAWNNLGDAYEKKKDYKSALKAFEEVLLFDPNNKVARPRRDSLKDRVKLYKGVPVKSKDR